MIAFTREVVSANDGQRYVLNCLGRVEQNAISRCYFNDTSESHPVWSGAKTSGSRPCASAGFN